MTRSVSLDLDLWRNTCQRCRPRSRFPAVVGHGLSKQYDPQGFTNTNTMNANGRPVNDTHSAPRGRSYMFFRRAPKFPKGTGVRCVICGREQANATCKKCGGKVCPTHSHYANGTYCQRCLVLCPQCKGSQSSAHSIRNTIELFCHSCGHRWTPI